jgi:NADPH:quinone reductase-like Zn-dependent oxidoreductase
LSPQLSGLKVFTTSSPKNFDYLKSLGADFVVDYRDPEAPKKIREASGDKIAHGKKVEDDLASKNK